MKHSLTSIVVLCWLCACGSREESEPMAGETLGTGARGSSGAGGDGSGGTGPRDGGSDGGLDGGLDGSVNWDAGSWPSSGTLTFALSDAEGPVLDADGCMRFSDSEVESATATELVMPAEVYITVSGTWYTSMVAVQRGNHGVAFFRNDGEGASELFLYDERSEENLTLPVPGNFAAGSDFTQTFYFNGITGTAGAYPPMASTPADARDAGLITSAPSDAGDAGASSPPPPPPPDPVPSGDPLTGPLPTPYDRTGIVRYGGQGFRACSVTFTDTL